MKIAIITIHHVPNYGAVLQAYALSRALARTGHAVEILDYRPQIAQAFYRPRLMRDWRPQVTRWRQYWGFQRFVRAHLPITRRRFTEPRDFTGLDYDLVVAGSDQLWCTSKQGSFRGFDPNFFLDFELPSRCRRASYAVSVGETDSFEEHRSRVATLLSRFDDIGVRDQQSQMLVEDVGREATLTVDPVFLEEFDALDERMAQPAGSQPTLVLAGGVDDTEAPAIRAIAKQRGLRIVALGHACAFADEVKPVMSPAEWLVAMKSAQFVVTTLFHGTAFAIKFGRPFLTIATESKRRKISDLLSRLSLEDRLVASVSQAALQDTRGRERVDVEPRLSSLVADSRAYLAKITSSQL